MSEKVLTSPGEDNLIIRLKTHFNRKQQRSSILRKNVGRCLLSIANDPYLEIWNKKESELINRGYELPLELKITDYLRGEMNVVCVEQEDLCKRIRWEEGIISSLYHDNDFVETTPDNWLGKSSPIMEINKSGLWCVDGLNAPSLNLEEFTQIKQSVESQLHHVK